MLRELPMQCLDILLQRTEGKRRALLRQTQRVRAELVRLILCVLDTRARDLCLLRAFRAANRASLPLCLHRLRGLLGLGQRRLRGALRLLGTRTLRLQRGQFAFGLHGPCMIGIEMRLRLAQAAFHLGLILLQLRAPLACVLQRLLQARDLGADTVKFFLRSIEGVIGVGLFGTPLFYRRLDPALIGHARLERGLLLGGLALARAHLTLQAALAQRHQLRLEAALFLLQALIAFGGTGLALQALQLFAQLFAHVTDARQILARVAHAVFRLAATFFIFGYARRLFQQHAQVVGLGLDQARDHALLDDGVAVRAETGAEEEIDDVAAAAARTVEEIIGLAVAPDLAPDRHLGVLRVRPAEAAVAVVEHQLDDGLAHRLASGSAVEDHIGHGFAAQALGRALAHHPAYRVDDVGLAAAVRADDGHQIARQMQCRRVYK